MSEFTPTPLASLFAPKNDIQFYRDHIKRMLIIVATNSVLPRMEPDRLIDALHRVFKLKWKVIDNLALRAKKEVEEQNRPLEVTINNLAFFTVVLFDYIDKNNNQPLNKEGLV